MKGNFLMGNSTDNISDGIYPLVFVCDITKEDLIRASRDDIVIINLDNKTSFEPSSNSWKTMKSLYNFKDMWS